MNECELRALLDDLNNTDYPADEMSRLVVTRLARRNIRHRPMLGRLTWQGKTLSPHFWVEVGDYLIDYCAGRELGAPAGVLRKSAVEACYSGQEIVIDALPDYLYAVLFKPAPERKAAA